MDVIYVVDLLCNMGFSLLLRTAWEQEKIGWVRPPGSDVSLPLTVAFGHLL